MAALPNRTQDFNTSNHSTANGVNGTHKQVNGERQSRNVDVDILIIGGGFGGMYGLHQLRKLGLSVKLFEAGADFGGTWYWNRYPGARVDSETPYYSLSIPEVYKNWTFSERFPGHEELREYFKHIDRTLNLSKDAVFDTIVTSARYNTDQGKWHVQTEDGSEATCKYLVSCTGSSYKKHFPDFKNLSHYKGQLIHSALYPDDLDVTGKKVCVIGSGATGVQIVQTLARKDCQLSACVRTPNVALPMRQRKLGKEEQEHAKGFYQSMLQSAKDCRSGFPYNPAPKTFFEASAEERLAYFEELWQRGGFSFLISNYREFLTDKDANREFYRFWADKVRARIRDPVKKDIMAPLEQSHWFGTKRPSLEQDYYEMIDRDNVTVVDLNKTPIEQFTESGIQFGDRNVVDFDIVILATGYDSVTGSLIDLGLTDIDGTSLAQKWKTGTYTYLGLTIDKLPNLFMVYSPQAPTSLSNGPPIIEIQIDWIADAIRAMREQKIKYIDAKFEAAEKWRNDIQEVNKLTLYPEARSWYMGDNIPGKPREQLLYLNGVDAYNQVTRDALDGWKGFNVVKA